MAQQVFRINEILSTQFSPANIVALVLSADQTVSEIGSGSITRFTINSTIFTRGADVAFTVADSGRLVLVNASASYVDINFPSIYTRRFTEIVRTGRRTPNTFYQVEDDTAPRFRALSRHFRYTRDYPTITIDDGAPTGVDTLRSGPDEIADYKLGDTDVDRMYLGSDEVYRRG